MLHSLFGVFWVMPKGPVELLANWQGGKLSRCNNAAI